MANDPKTGQRKLVAYLSSPQQWNRFAYVVNNPLKHIDPDGERIEIFGTEAERKQAFDRIKAVVGARGATMLEVRQEGDHFFVEVKKNDYPGLFDLGFLESRVAAFIASRDVLEFHVATTFESKAGRKSVSSFGGGVTLGADESLTGHTQIFVHPDAGDKANDVFFNTMIGQTRSSEGSRGRGLFFYNDTVDAHEFGHAWANMMFNTPLHGSRAEESYPYAHRFENEIRQRRGDTARRIKE